MDIQFESFTDLCRFRLLLWTPGFQAIDHTP